MLVSLRRASALALLAVAGTVTSSACVRNDSTMFIRGCMAVPPTCTLTVSVSSEMRFGGSLDRAYLQGGQYQCAALVENQMVPRGDTTKVRTETSRITFYEANVELFGPSATAYDGTPIGKFTAPVNGFADPGTGTEPGVGAAVIPLTDSATLAKVKPPQTIVARVELHGRTLGGLEVHSNLFEWPIDVLEDTASCFVPSDGCRPDTGGNVTAAGCYFGQDGATNCQLLPDADLVSGAGGLVCPPIP